MIEVPVPRSSLLVLGLPGIPLLLIILTIVILNYAFVFPFVNYFV